MAESSPAFIHSSKNIEFKFILASGDKPKLIFDIPRIIWQFLILFLILFIAIIVSLAFNLSSSIPVEIGKAKGSKNISWSEILLLLVLFMALSAILNFFSEVLAIPSSSIVPITNPAP